MTPRISAHEEDTLNVPAGRVLILGPSRSGKTTACARALAAYLNANGPQGVAVLDFAPAHRMTDGRVIGERIDRYLPIPSGVLHFVVPTRAPRASTNDPAAAVEIARENQAACSRILERLPRHVNALFVNDATMAYHVPGADPRPLIERVQSADFAVLTALDPVHFDDHHPITKQERIIITALKRHVEHVLHTDTHQRPNPPSGHTST